MRDESESVIVTRDQRHESYQGRVAKEIASAVRDHLKDTVRDKRDLQHLVERISFEVCCIIDGSAVMTLGEKPVLPVLLFSESREHPETLITHIGGLGSYMHELLPEITDDMFTGQEERSAEPARCT